MITRHRLTSKDLHEGRLVSWSKSEYVTAHPSNRVYFNANIFTESEGKVWYGDLDVTVSMSVLQSIANEGKETLYILRELDGRFGNETIDISVIKSKAVEIIKPEI